MNPLTAPCALFGALVAALVAALPASARAADGDAIKPQSLINWARA